GSRVKRRYAPKLGTPRYQLVSRLEGVKPTRRAATVGGGVTGETSGYILRIGTLLGLEDQLEKGAPQQCEPILVGPNTRSPRGIKQAHRDKVAEVLLESGGKSGGAANTVGCVQLSLVQANEISSRGRAGRLQLQRVLKNQW